MKGLIDGDPQKFFATDVDPVHAQVISAVQQPIANSEFMGSEAFARPLWRCCHPGTS